MMRIFFTAIAFMLAAAAVSYAQEVKYIDAPKFDGQIYSENT